MDDYSQIDVTALRKHSREWAIGANLLGGIFTLAAPMMLVFEVLFTDARFRIFQSELERNLSIIASAIMGLIVMTTLAISMILGFRSYAAANAESSSRVLSLTGILLSLFAFVAWGGMTVNMFAILGVIR